MNKTFIYGWKCNDDCGTRVYKRIYFVGRWFVLKEGLKSLWKDFLFAKKYKYTFFILGFKGDSEK